jgi:hypothetical protein
MGEPKGFGLQEKQKELVYRYEHQYVLIGNPSDLRGGLLEEIHIDGVFFRPFILHTPDGYVLREKGQLFMAHPLLNEITPLAGRADLEEILLDVNQNIRDCKEKRTGVKRNGVKRRILLPEDVTMIVHARYDPLSGSNYIMPNGH